MRQSRRSWCKGIAATLALPWAARSAEGEVVVAQVGPFTGLPVPDAANLNQGLKAYFSQANGRGGINGRRVRLIEIDDGYTPDGSGFIKAYQEAIQRKAVALLSPLGSVAIKRMLDERLLDKADVIVVNAVPGAEALRDPGHPLLFHVRAGDRQQIEKIVQHVRTLGINRLGVVHQNIPMGDSGLAAARRAVERSADLRITSVQAAADPASLAGAAAQLVKEQVQAGLLVGAPRYSAELVAALRKAGFSQFIFALTDTSARLLVKVAGPGSRGVGVTQVVPNPNGATLPLQRDFQAAMRASFPDAKGYSSLNLEGYVTARIFAEAARQSKDLGAESLARAVRGLGELDMGGLRVNFAKSNVGGSFVDIGVVSADGRLMY